MAPKISSALAACGLRLVSHEEEEVVTDGEGIARVIIGSENLTTTRLLVRLCVPETNAELPDHFVFANPSYGRAGAGGDAGDVGPHFVVTALLPEANGRYLLKIFCNGDGSESFSSAVTYTLTGPVAATLRLPKLLAAPAPIALLSPIVQNLTVGESTTFRVGLSPDIGSVRVINGDGRQQPLAEEKVGDDRVASTSVVIAEGTKAEIICCKAGETSWSVFARFGIVHASGEAAAGSDCPPDLFDIFKECNLRLVSHIHRTVDVDESGTVRIIIGAKDIDRVRMLPKINGPDGAELPDGHVMVNPSFGGAEAGDAAGAAAGPHFSVDVALPAPGNYVLKLHLNNDQSESFSSGVNYTLVNPSGSSTTTFPKLFPLPVALHTPKTEILKVGSVPFRLGVSPAMKLVQIAHPDGTRSTLPIANGIASADVEMKEGLAKLICQLDGAEGLTVFTKFTVQA